VNSFWTLLMKSRSMESRYKINVQLVQKCRESIDNKLARIGNAMVPGLTVSSFKQ
jgi:hypothetical protein